MGVPQQPDPAPTALKACFFYVVPVSPHKEYELYKDVMANNMFLVYSITKNITWHKQQSSLFPLV